MKKSPPTEIDEDDFLIQSFMALPKSSIKMVLDAAELKTAGNKDELRQRVKSSLAVAKLNHDSLIHALDAVTPWWKQHVYLFDGPQQRPLGWASPKDAEAHLKSKGLSKYIGKGAPVLLPDELTLTSISFASSVFKALAVRKRVYRSREPELDDWRKSPTGEAIELRAYVTNVKRNMVSFEWDLGSNEAHLRMSEMPSESHYSDMMQEFAALVSQWLPFQSMKLLNIRKSIAALHVAEEKGSPEARSHGIQYQTPLGRTLSGRSLNAGASVLGEPVIDQALAGMRKNGLGRYGNFYWLLNGLPGVSTTNNQEAHVVVHAEHGRVSFKRNTNEAIVRHVLTRLRKLSA